jgi:hypothetical protein
VRWVAMMGVALTLALVGCGDSDPSPQDAEEQVRETVSEASGGAFEVKGVFCEEQEGAERFVCEVDTDAPPVADVPSSVIVSFDDID